MVTVKNAGGYEENGEIPVLEKNIYRHQIQHRFLPQRDRSSKKDSVGIELNRIEEMKNETPISIFYPFVPVYRNAIQCFLRFAV